MEDRWLQLRDSIGMTRATLKRYATQVRGGRRAPAHRQCHRPAPMHAFHTRLRALATSPHTQYPTLAVDILVKPVKVLDLLSLPLL